MDGDKSQSEAVHLQCFVMEGRRIPPSDTGQGLETL